METLDICFGSVWVWNVRLKKSISSTLCRSYRMIDRHGDTIGWFDLPAVHLMRSSTKLAQFKDGRVSHQ